MIAVIAVWIWVAIGFAVVVVVIGGATLLTGRRRGGGFTRPPSQRPETPAAAPVTEAPTAPPSRGPLAPPEPEAPTVEVPTFRDRLGRARGVFAGLRGLRGRAVAPEDWDDLEEMLLRADVGVATTDALLADLRRRVDAKEVVGGDDLVTALRADVLDILAVERRWDGATDAELAAGHGALPGADFEVVAPVGRGLRFDEEPGVVNVWLFVGVNGVGKTTTVGKLARQQAAAGRSVLLAAGDTFRAAAGEQLSRWAERTGAELARGAEGGDPSAVVFDAVQRAAARGNDLVLADTAGRLHTKVNLVEELKKIRRVADRPPGRVTEVLLVLDATTGQNGLAQARQFTEAVAVTGVALTKLDGTAKGGIVLAIQRELGLPVKLVGLGEGPDDLVPFDAEEFVGALLGA
ncbi:MAG: signal recognition particle-docking protein FtsY [Acidimicrobiales bacterium]